MEKPEFSFEKRPEAEGGPERIEEILADVIVSYKEKVWSKETPYSFIDFEDVARAVETGGIKERALEEKNPEIEFNVSRSRNMRELFQLANRARTSREARADLSWAWQGVESCKIDEIKSLKDGTLNQAQAVYLLKNQGFEVKFSRPIEDAVASIDLYARHPNYKDSIFVIQVKPNREGLRPTATSLEGLPLHILNGLEDPYRQNVEKSYQERETVEQREKEKQSLGRMLAYTKVLQHLYQDKFIPILTTVPSVARAVELDWATGYPNQAYLDKYRDLINIDKEVKRVSEKETYSKPELTEKKEVKKHGRRRVYIPGQPKKDYGKEAQI